MLLHEIFATIRRKKFVPALEAALITLSIMDEAGEWQGALEQLSFEQKDRLLSAKMKPELKKLLAEIEPKAEVAADAPESEHQEDGDSSPPPSPPPSKRTAVRSKPAELITASMLKTILADHSKQLLSQLTRVIDQRLWLGRPAVGPLVQPLTSDAGR